MNNKMQSYSETVLPIIRSVREMLLPYYGKVDFQSKQSDKKFELVTELDMKIEQFLKTELANVYPHIAFVGEETGGDKSVPSFWLVDPIDGTTCFIRGVPFCSTMIALVENSKVVFSVIYDFVNDVLYSAEKGKGAFANGIPIHVSDRPLDGAYLAWETHLDKKENYAWYSRLRKRTVLWHWGVSGAELVGVATGKVDGRICIDAHGSDYDFAAGTFLVSEAGGVVANVGSREYNFRNTDFIATNPTIFKELTEGENPIFPITN